jgi:muramoyltetrapeptide carboxypeptidase LdcA involved in peptidoglycan recycling
MLKPGDRLASVSLSWGGPGAIPLRYLAGKRQLQETFNVQLVEMPHALADPDWLWRNPQARADDLMQAFDDPAIKGIVSSIGGDDSLRILPYLDLDLIARNPKVFLGFSDTTVTHLACFKAGLTTFYGPSVMAGFAENGGMFDYTIHSLRRTLFAARPAGALPPNLIGWTEERLEWAIPENQARKRSLSPYLPWKFLQGEELAQGRLLGGCIEVLDWLRGTPYWPSPDDWQNAILFIESSEDGIPAAQVGYTLRAWGALGIFERINGLLFGRPGGRLAPEKFAEFDQAILKIVRDEFGRPDLPVVTQMDFGHTEPSLTLPYGVMAEIDPPHKRVSIIEAAVQ